MFVRLWMTPDPITVTPDETISAAYTCLKKHNIRRLVVVDSEDRLVGILSKQDLADAMPSIMDGSSAGSPQFLTDSAKVEDVMTTHPMWIEPLAPMESAARQMHRHKIGGLPVMENGRLAGIITESDIFKAFLELLGPEDEGTRIEFIISKKSGDLYEVLDIFKRYDIFVQAIAIHHNFGENQRLLTTRLAGNEIEPMLDALRSSGVVINSIEDNEL